MSLTSTTTFKYEDNAVEATVVAYKKVISTILMNELFQKFEREHDIKRLLVTILISVGCVKDSSFDIDTAQVPRFYYRADISPTELPGHHLASRIIDAHAHASEYGSNPYCEHTPEGGNDLIDQLIKITTQTTATRPSSNDHGGMVLQELFDQILTPGDRYDGTEYKSELASITSVQLMVGHFRQKSETKEGDHGTRSLEFVAHGLCRLVRLINGISDPTHGVDHENIPDDYRTTDDDVPGTAISKILQKLLKVREC